jgi:YidC/Oxa1 family membrane protein insertase
MEKRVLVAVLLSFLVLAAYQAYFAPKTPDAATADASTASTVAPGAPAAGATAGSPASPSAPNATGAAKTAPAAPATPLIGDTAARDVVVDTDSVLAVFSTEGAVLKSWKLKNYPAEPGTAKDKDHPEPLDLVPADVPGDRPFTLTTADPTAAAILTHALYRPSVDHLSLGSAPGTLTFEYQDQSGLGARKTFHFQPDGKPYNLGLDASVDVSGKAQPITISWGPALGLGYMPDGSRESQPAAGIFLRNDKVERPAAKTFAETPQYTDTFHYVGVSDHYFLSVIFPGQRQVKVQYAPITVPVPNDTTKKNVRTFVSYSLSMQESAAITVFFGPKDFSILKAVDPQLARAIDFGFFDWLVKPLLQALKWVNGFVHNWGWSIVVLTILMNLAIFPLRHRSMVSMKKMQALQPKVKAIQDRYAKYKITDPERQKANQEVMELYKTKGVNPASGCVPMLLTMPLLFAFYALLGSAIELRGAPFMFWIHDLSLRDPFYILPIIMAASMFWQQRMMPTAGADPMQQKMFMFMPLIFLFSFLWSPSGLAVYWFTSNLMAIGQQYVTNRMIASGTVK